MCLICLAGGLQAQETRQTLSQYVRRDWTSGQGFPGGPVYGFAQTPDGYLWIGTEEGLVRFDGSNFRSFNRAEAALSPIGPVLGLVTDAEGDLWVRLPNARLVRYRDGAFDEMERSLAIPEKAITAMGAGIDQQPLFSTVINGILTYRRGHLVVLKGQVPSIRNFLPISVAQTEDGSIWLGTLEAGLFTLKNGDLLPGPGALRNRKINCLMASKGGDLWIGTDDGLLRWDRAKFVPTGLPASLERVQVLAITQDHESNVWVGTADGLLRIDPTGNVSRQANADQQSGGITALFVDREDNVWAGNGESLEQLRSGAFTTYSSREGLRPGTGAVYADSFGRIWFAPLGGGLFWLKDGQVHQVRSAGLDRDVVYSIAGRADELWLGRQNGGLTNLRDTGGSFTTQTYKRSQGLAQNSVYSVWESADGTVWAGTLNAGLSEYKNGHFQTYTTANGLSSNSITSIVQTVDGTTWVGTPAGLNRLSQGKWKSYTAEDGLPTTAITCLTEGHGVLWIGTLGGVAFLSAGKIESPHQEPDSLRDAILGIAEGSDGRVWVSNANGFLSIDRDKLLSLDVSDQDVHEYGLADGLRGTQGVNRDRSLAVDPQGNIWFSTSEGLSVVNPERAEKSGPPAVLHIDGMSADGRAVKLIGPIRIPAPHQRITIRFSGLSLSIPSRVRFKFMLDGFDRGWSETTSAHQAAYTNLPPGPYRFRLLASNSFGQWNSVESAVQFQVEPVFWQTWWFRILCVFVFCLMVMLLLRFRMIRLAKQMNVRFEERLGERTRIARELHDTLLQSLHGVLFEFQAARNMFSRSPQKAIETLDEAIAATEHAIAESRDAIQDLRSESIGGADLPGLLTEASKELAESYNGTHSAPAFRMIVEGDRRDLSPALQEDVYQIAREVLRNAFRHAEAHAIEAEIRYDADEFRLRLRDDGKGIAAAVLGKGGRSGHWGLSGMRERAQQIGAQLNVWSEAGAGTELQLTVPAALAYGTPHESLRAKLLRKVGSHVQRT